MQSLPAGVVPLIFGSVMATAWFVGLRRRNRALCVAIMVVTLAWSLWIAVFLPVVIGRGAVDRRAAAKTVVTPDHRAANMDAVMEASEIQVPLVISLLLLGGFCLTLQRQAFRVPQKERP